MFYTDNLKVKNKEEFRADVSKLGEGDRLTFGRYEICSPVKPDESGIFAPIVWRILKKQGDVLLLLSEYCLDWDFFDGSSSPDGAGWAQSTIREDLNTDFYGRCFTAEEKRLIITSRVLTPHSGTGENEETRDRLFLLSSGEAMSLFSSGENDRGGEGVYLTGPASDAVLIFAEAADGENGAELSFESCSWWLRTDGCDRAHKTVVRPGGFLDTHGAPDGADEIGIRPAVRIDLGALR